MALTDEHLQGTRLLNIDSEEEGVFLVSCAGGANIHVFFDIKKEAAKGKFLKITVGGLLGGHSGIEINKQRANSIKLLGRILYNIKQNEKINIVEISGGSKHNAIAKDAHAVIAAENTEAVLKIVEKMTADFKGEYRAVDKLLTVTANETQNPSGQMFTKELTLNLIDFMASIPNGVQYMSMEIHGLVQTSLNNGVLEEIDGRIKFTTSVRSSVKSALDEIVDILRIQAEHCGGEFKKVSEYPAWEYSPDSPVRDAAVNVYKKLNKKEPVITAIHAGLECGLLKKTLPNVDAVSFGPNLYDVHTPNEHMDIASVERVWKFLLAYLAELKN